MDSVMSLKETHEFWHEVFSWTDSATPRILLNVLGFGLLSCLIVLASGSIEARWHMKLGLPLGPQELTGTVLGLVLVFRTNAGYERWWEARRLWGGIVNQSRNLAIGAVAFGGSHTDWRNTLLKLIASFSHAARHSLRDDPDLPDVERIAGPDPATAAIDSDHSPAHIALLISQKLKEALDAGWITGFEFQQLDRERITLIDHIGGCERIRKTPMPRVSSIKIRQFLVLFLISLPLSLLHKLDAQWLNPILTMLVAFPLLSLDEIGEELQYPFDPDGISPLPLESICQTIETNVLSLSGKDDK